jgi:hypothetical protein
MHRIAALLCPLLLLSGTAAAQDRCKHTEPHGLTLDMGDARTVVFDIGASELRLDGKTGAAARIGGQACASHADGLAQLSLTQERVGDKLVVRAARAPRVGIVVGNQYAYFKLSATVPADVAVQVDVGSGDAWIDGVRSLALDVGSGDAEARRIQGPAWAKVGSGDVSLTDSGPLEVLSIGSGDVVVDNVRGDTTVGSIGSGDFKLRRSSGGVSIASIGSGDAELSDIAGSVRIGSVGSGDLDVQGVGGGLTVSSLGSGDVDHGGVRGTVDLPRRR